MFFFNSSILPSENLTDLPAKWRWGGGMISPLTGVISPDRTRWRGDEGSRRSPFFARAPSTVIGRDVRPRASTRPRARPRRALRQDRSPKPNRACKTSGFGRESCDRSRKLAAEACRAGRGALRVPGPPHRRGLRERAKGGHRGAQATAETGRKVRLLDRRGSLRM